MRNTDMDVGNTMDGCGVDGSGRRRDDKLGVSRCGRSGGVNGYVQRSTSGEYVLRRNEEKLGGEVGVCTVIRSMTGRLLVDHRRYPVHIGDQYRIETVSWVYPLYLAGAWQCIRGRWCDDGPEAMGLG